MKLCLETRATQLRQSGTPKVKFCKFFFFFFVFFQFFPVIKKSTWKFLLLTSLRHQYHLCPLCYQKPTLKLKIKALLLLQKLMTDRKKHIILKSIHSSLHTKCKTPILISSMSRWYCNISWFVFDIDIGMLEVIALNV